MRVFQCSYHWNGRFGAFQNYEYVVIASCESEALGLVLMEKKETDADGWTVEEIDTTTAEAHHISSQCS